MIGIILAGGRGTRMASVSKLPKALLPVAGKPVIQHIVDELRRHRVNDIRVVCSPENIQSILDATGLPPFLQQEPNGPGAGLLLAARAISAEDQPVVVVCADTIFRVPELPHEDSVLVALAPSTRDFGRWCYVLYDPTWKFVQGFLDKPIELPKSSNVINMGVYVFEHLERLQEINPAPIGKELQISEVIEEYGMASFRAVEAKWWDTGSPDQFMRTRRQMFTTRSFNSTKLVDGRVVKRSPDKEKLRCEANWYDDAARRIEDHLPPDVQYDQNVGELSMGYVPYNTLSDYYLFGGWTWKLEYWSEYLMKILMEVDEPAKQDFGAKKDLWRLVVGKTNERVKQTWPKVSHFWTSLQPRVESLVGKMDPIPGYFHGDLNLTNILSDDAGKDYVVVDPRGGEIDDRRYDAAKMLQSLYGYDHVLNGLYDTVDGKCVPHQNEGHRILTQDFEKALTTYGFDLKELRVVVGCQFLSMIPLHKESPKRQDAFFAMGKEILQEALQ